MYVLKRLFLNPAKQLPVITLQNFMNCESWYFLLQTRDKSQFPSFIFVTFSSFVNDELAQGHMHFTSIRRQSSCMMRVPFLFFSRASPFISKYSLHATFIILLFSYGDRCLPLSSNAPSLWVDVCLVVNTQSHTSSIFSIIFLSCVNLNLFYWRSTYKSWSSLF